MRDLTREELIAYFERYFKKGGPEECWLFMESAKNYGKIRIGKKWISAHRVSYILYKGKIEKGLFICHTCDTPACVNPNHLFKGTHGDNMRDKESKNRGNHKEGGKRLFTVEQAKKIVKIYESGKSLYTIAKKLNVSRSTLRNIIYNDTYELKKENSNEQSKR